VQGHPILDAGKAVGQPLPGRTAVLVIGWHVDEILLSETPFGFAVGGLRLGHDRANARLLTGQKFLPRGLFAPDLQYNLSIDEDTGRSDTDQ
jgi:hypothetical protein